ncbi:hypothetical protein FPQ10_09025 [Allobacillus sp. SKP2-8]|uniref:hypothetical protein n=1 Tax=unclassified Allobacillus TaxID=2628859 RepID=UPI0011838502|nr:hypothetical protein [Allobacillus sp. SKP2-8]TSJ65768.1 hypothetical protein FPQ10_09025 [Allobacillus sp. SKP2-8]
MNLIAWTIVACEVGFWIFIIAGLVMRYIFNQKRIGILLLAMTPVVDLILILVTGIDMYRGGEPTTADAIAPIYIAVSIIYGKSIIQWADERFAYYVKREGPKPPRRVGIEYAKHSMKGSLQHILAYMIGGAILLFMIYYIGNDTDTTVLESTLKFWGIIVIVDNVISLTYFIWPREK